MNLGSFNKYAFISALNKGYPYEVELEDKESDYKFKLKFMAINNLVTISVIDNMKGLDKDIKPKLNKTLKI